MRILLSNHRQLYTVQASSAVRRTGPSQMIWVRSHYGPRIGERSPAGRPRRGGVGVLADPELDGRASAGWHCSGLRFRAFAAGLQGMPIDCASSGIKLCRRQPI
jgi:hypothetical protein